MNFPKAIFGIESSRPQFRACEKLVNATQGNVVRPRAYYELARLRYEAFTDDAAPEAKLTASQRAEIMAPLLAARRQQPPLPQTSALITNVLARSDAPPTAEQLALLHEGARNFPHLTGGK